QSGHPAASSQPNKKLIPLKAKEGPIPTNTWKARSPPGPAPKPKTVSELLREKRLREQMARKGAQKRIFLAPQLLLSTSVMVPQTRGPINPLANCPYAPMASQASPRPPPALASGPLGPLPGRELASSTDLVGGSQERTLPCNGEKDEAAREEGRDGNQESFLPQEDPEVAGAPAGPPANVNSILADALCPSPASGALPPLPPTLVAAHSQPSAVAQPTMPISWVLTPQGLLPVTLLSLPSQGKPLASGTPPNPSKPAETSVKIPTPTMGDPVIEGPPMQAGHPSGCPQSDAGTRLMNVPPPLMLLLGNSTEAGCPPSPAGARAPSLPCTVFGGTGASIPNSEAQPNQGPAALEVPSDPALQACPPQEGQQEKPSQPDLEALRQAVRQKLQDNPAYRLQDNPAYRLLRERFLAAFSFPAALAALPPPRVATTLSGGRWWESSQGEDSSSSLEEGEEEGEEEEGEEEAEREPQGATRDGPAETMVASEELEEPGTDVDSDHSSRIRRSRRLQKRGVHL
ncbi:snRNA-activating protein complex subunit 4, partial [Ophiophagus hannah]